MQIWAIHGGDAFASYEEYLEYLKTRQINLKRLNSWDWKSHLGGVLGARYEVFMPQMPNKQNAKYAEWKIWLERFIPYMDEEIILIGHSLGGCFVAKYLAGTDFPKRIRATFVVAAPYDEAEHSEFAKHLYDFAPPKNLERLVKQGGKIFLYQSKDDPVVSFSELAKYQEALPNAIVRVFEDREHFNQKSFPELVEDIKSLETSK
ncbi:MAG: alpha/beta hydrolase [Patescibacteria group bacterium]|nr:alpha/beta hydrolase [Patescibacteria group bacterium]